MSPYNCRSCMTEPQKRRGWIATRAPVKKARMAAESLVDATHGFEP